MNIFSLFNYIQKKTSSIILIILSLATIQFTEAATITSTASGNWGTGATWVGGVAPASGDNAVIANGHTVTLTVSKSITNFTINTEGILSDGGFNLTVSGNLLINGTYNGNGSGRLLLTGNGKTIDGSGTINNINRMNMTASTTKTILATANLTFTGANQLISILSNNTVTNNGTVTVGRVTGSNATTSVWINSANAILNIGADLLSTGKLTATATENSINYNGAVAQSIKVTTYHHLLLSNTLAKTAGGALTVNGNFTISGTATFNGGTSRTHTFLGNWVINSTATTPFSFTTASTINFNTSGTPAATSLGGTSAATIGFNKVNFNNTSGFSSSLNFNITGTLTVAANVVFTPAAAVVINSAATQGTITGSGTVKATRTAATANYTNQYKFTTQTLTNLTVDYAGTAAQIANALTYGNLKISNTAAAVTTSGNITVNGVLTLNANLANGDLAMGTDTLITGASATTAGTGDVTGVVKRTTINANTEYSFGNQFTTITFPAVGTLPTEMAIKISIGTAPSWKTSAINRYYEIVQTGGSGSMFTLQLHYKDEELNGNTESNMSLWHYHVGNSDIEDHGKSNSNATNNWISLSGIGVNVFTSGFGNYEWSIADREATYITWDGDFGTDWTNAGNWLGGVPGTNDDVVIPLPNPGHYSPTLTASTTIKSLQIDSGATLNGGTGTTLTISGSNWINNGTFNPGTSTVIFTNATASVAGETNFYDVTIAVGADLTMTTNNIMRISGTITNSGTWRARYLVNTVEYNGTNQTLIKPNGGSGGYYHLILSNSGSKTTSENLTVAGDFTLSGTAIFNAGTSLTHSFSGNWVVNTSAATPFSFTTANTVNFDTPEIPAATSLGGSSTATVGFNTVNFNNTSGISSSLNFNITGTLTVAANVVFTPAAAVVINSAATQGTITGSGTVQVTRTAATADYLSQYKFTTHTLTNLTVDYAGTAAQAANALTYGNLKMSNTAATATASGNITVNGVLTLNANLANGDLAMGANTLTMGASATTTGLGDVTGIVKRTTINPDTEYSFGNQFTTITFAAGGTLPTEMAVKIYMGTAPSWKTDAVIRYYDIIQTGGSGSSLTLQLHYNNGELNGNTNGNMDLWHYHYGNGDVEEHGKSDYNTTDNWISLAGIGINVFTSNFSDYEFSIADIELTAITWDGDFGTDWTNAGNWLGGVPGTNDNVVIPIPNPGHYSLTLPASATVKSLTIDSGATLNGGTGTTLTIAGDSGWRNNGTFNSGTSTVIFSGTTATIGGTTDFYNVTIATGAILIPLTGNTMRIAGILTNDGELDARTNTNNIVEYNGGDQTVINPNGGIGGYCYLTLSGTGTKTLPATPLDICESLTLSGTVSATANATISIANNLIIETGTSFDAGVFNHYISGNISISGTLTAQAINVGGDWTNTGTFTAGTGTVTFDGNGTQTITKSEGEVFNNLVLDGSGIKTLGGNITAKDLTINNILDVSATNYTINLQGNWANNGSFNAQTGTVICNGTAVQTIGGTAITSFRNLTINNAAGVSLGSSQKLIETLTLTSGTFTTTGQTFTLVSDANGTANIAAITGGNIVGNITMQRYLPSTSGGYKQIGAAVTGTTLEDWIDNFTINGIPGSTNPAKNSTIYTYDETLSGTAGYVKPTNITNPIVSGKGYYTWISAVPVTIDVTAPPAKFNQTLPITYTSTGSPANDGWNLLANPYPATIDWDAASGWTKTNINNAIYIWDPSILQYASYVGGIGTNGGSKYIPSSQAFWVQANAASPVLNTTESVKSGVDQSFLKTVKTDITDNLKLIINGNNYRDETVISFSSKANIGFDGGMDAKKMFSSSTKVPSISTIADTIDMAINSLPELTSDVTIPVRVKVGVTGTYTLQMDSSFVLPLSSCITLEDLTTGTITDLRKNSSYTFTIPKTTQSPRFLIHLSPPIAKQSIQTSCNKSSDGKAISKGIGTGPFDYEWKDALGNIIQKKINVVGADTLLYAAAGTYTVTIKGNSCSCGSLSDTLVVTEPLSINPLITRSDVNCSGYNDGIIDILAVTGGNAPYSFKWSGGQTTRKITNLSAGTYTVSITDNNGCSFVTAVSIQSKSLVNSAFSTDADTLYLSHGGILNFTNLSVAATSYLWDFGDGSLADTSANPNHNYNLAGTYTVLLIAYDGICSDTNYYSIEVLDSPLGITKNENLSIDAQIISTNEGLYVQFNLNEMINATISVYNTLGQKAIDDLNVKVISDKIKILLPQQAEGVFFIKVQTGNKIFVRKVFIGKS